MFIFGRCVNARNILTCVCVCVCVCLSVCVCRNSLRYPCNMLYINILCTVRHYLLLSSPLLSYHLYYLCPDGQMYWDEKQQSSSPDKSEMWNYHKASTHKVEIAAYALLMYIKLDKYLDGLPITNFLIDQRNPNGGYRSTQVSRRYVASKLTDFNPPRGF